MNDSHSRTRYVLDKHPFSDEVDLGGPTRPPTDMDITLDGVVPGDEPTEHAAPTPADAELAAAIFSHGDPTARAEFETFKADPDLADEGPSATALAPPEAFADDGVLDVVELPVLEGQPPRDLELTPAPAIDFPEPLAELSDEDPSFALPPAPRPLDETVPPSPPAYLHQVTPPAFAHPPRAAGADRHVSATEQPHLLFSVENFVCAIALGQILEVVPCRSLTPAASGPSFLLGRANHAGQSIPVISLRRLCQLPQGDALAARRWLVVQSNDDKKRRAYLEVDRVDGVRRFLAVAAALSTPMPLQVGIFLLAAIELERELIACLDVDRIVQEAEAEPRDQ